MKKVIQHDLSISVHDADIILSQSDVCHENGESAVYINRSQIDGVIEALISWRDGQWQE